MASDKPARSYDSWLSHFHDERLSRIDAELANRHEDGYRMFRGLDDDLWAVLLFGRYSAYPEIKRFLPDLPPPEFQRKWNHAAGMRLAPRSNAFYGKLKGLLAAHGATPLADARVLDFGCGWGRMTRFFSRDVEPGNLFGCDASDESLALCEQLRVPALLGRNDPLAAELPFDSNFDLIFAHSVFTHQSEPAHEACLRAIHNALEPGGIAVITVRPPQYVERSPRMAGVRDRLEPGAGLELDQPRYYFQPGSAKNSRMGPSASGQPGDPETEPTFGNTFITHAYMQERWTRWFEIVEIPFMLESMTQVIVALRRRAA